MGVHHLPEFIQNNYEVTEWHHASAILERDFPDEWSDLLEVLTNFRLYKSHIIEPGGRKSPIANLLDGEFYERNWKETQFDTKIVVDGKERSTPTHNIDCYKNKIGIEIEWNNKDPFYDRDLNNFRLLHELRVISVGIIITRCSALQEIFKTLGKGASYGASTTHMSKLLPRIRGGGAGGCPLLVFGISQDLYVEDC